MKYKLLKQLPFMQIGDIFGKGSWAGGGWGVDRGEDKHGSHNGTTVFEEFENSLLDSIIDKKTWIEWVPENKSETLKLFEVGRLTREQYLSEL